MADEDGTFDGEDIEKLFSTQRLIYRITEFLPEDLSQETSIYTLTAEEDRFSLAQVVSLGDHTVCDQRIILDTKLIKRLLPHLQRSLKKE